MACGGFKYEGIIFNNKAQLIDYVSKGIKPESNISLQEVKNDVIKNSLSSNDINSAISDIIQVSELTNEQRAALSSIPDSTSAYINYVETGKLPSNNLRTVFQDISTFIKDAVSSIDYSNSQAGSKPIQISDQIREFNNKIKINDSKRFIPSISGSESGSSSVVPSMEKSKWFNPRQEGAQATGTEVQPNEAIGRSQDNQADGNANIGRQQPWANSQDSTESVRNTARNSGIDVGGHPKRIQLTTGEYVSWDADRRQWSNVVRNVSGDRWGTVRTASQRERDAAANERQSRIITTDSDRDTAIDLIFNDSDPLINLQQLKAMGYINLNPTELYNKLKAQFDNNGIGIDQIANAIGTELYPSFLSKETEYPSDLQNPKQFFSNLGFAAAQTELLSFIHGLIPDAYNKTNTAIEIAMELMYPQKGFNLMNMMPYTKEEVYDIMTKYQNENISQNLGDIFLHEYLTNDISFGMQRNKDLLENIINKAKSLQIELPQQYENYFQATNKFKTFFQKGQKLRNKEDVLYVHDINYSNPEDITYVLWHPQEDAYYEMDMLKMDLFREDTESDFSNVEEDAVAVINSLQELGTMVRFMPQQDQPGVYNIFNNEIYLDVRKLSSRLLYHEAAHAVFVKGIRLNKENATRLHSEISSVLREGTPQERALAQRLDFFIQRYTEQDAEAARMPLEELRAHEFLAELVAQLSSSKSQITKRSEKSIIDKIIELFRNLFGYSQNLDIKNIDDVIDMINGISEKLRTGETINFSDYENMMSDENRNKGVFYARGDYYTGDVKKVLTPGVKMAATLPDGKGSMVEVIQSGMDNDGNGYVDLKFSDGRIESYRTEHLVLRENSLGKLFIYMVPAADQKANPTHKGNVMSDKDKAILKDFALDQNETGEYEYSIADIYALIKDDINVDYNIFIDIINGYREEKALQDAKNADPIGDDIYNDFIDNGTVPYNVLESIASKVATKKKLSEREKAIFYDKTSEINQIIIDGAETPTPKEPVEPSPKKPMDDKKLQKVLGALRAMSVTPEAAEILKGNSKGKKLINFDSGETIMNKTGEAPENSQLAVVFEIKKALAEGRQHLADLKEYFGEDAFNQIIDVLNTNNQAGIVGTSVMFTVMSQDIVAAMDAGIENRAIGRAMQRKLNRFMQAHARNASISMNLQRAANINPDELFYDSSDAYDVILTPDKKEAKDAIVEALEQEELDEAYLDYSRNKETTNKTYTASPKPKSSSGRRKSDRSKWQPRGGGFLTDAINKVRDYINKNC